MINEGLEREITETREEVLELRKAILKMTFPEKYGLSSMAGDPEKWPFTVGYRALGGRIENGKLLDTWETLKNDQSIH